ncbi:uncharacterized protein EI90DRAFT_3243071 [Cantharellus anzutake]|uniref:uncharacterized protein n=1 Tax=Cantharellus anzutake TaxID=1750568 RepID=UPI00190760B7|nr:uncharacterized protein EI90DRAFT_3243071 [Cantharellus anzutake]KAF8339982.1 hypothetical protein EI90DRAFT_3243071 [Cantharellus anzutake]
MPARNSERITSQIVGWHSVKETCFNRYYPPDFDPQKHGTLNEYHGKHALGDRARKIDKGVLIVRFELPFNIWCGTCNNHIGMGVRYNAEKKKVGNYYSTPIWSFRCKCHLCGNTAYVVVSGARKQEQDWDPAEAGGFAVHDTAGPSQPSDAFAAVEKTVAAETTLIEVTRPRLSTLQELSERRNANPYALSSSLRKTFRKIKKAEKRAEDEEKAVRDKFALPEELHLVKEDDVREEAKEEWVRSRREWEMEEEVRQKKFDSNYGHLGINGVPPKVTSKLASSLLRNSLKKQGALLPSISTSRSLIGRKLVAKDIGVVKKR